MTPYSELRRRLEAPRLAIACCVHARHWALLNRVPGCNIRHEQPGREARMTSISTVGHADVRRRAQGQIAQPFARPRPHLPDAGGAAAPRRHPLHLFRSHRPEVILRLRHDRARHRQFLHGDVLFPVGAVRLAGHRPQGTAELFAGSPASAWPALRDLRVHGHSARLLRHLAAAPSRDRLFGILVEYGHEGPVAERTDLVPLGLVRLRPGCLPAVSAVAQPARSDQSPLAARPPPARGVLRGHACRHRGVLRSRAGSLRTRQLVRVRAVLGPARARDALCDLLLFRCRHRRCANGSRAARGRRPDGEGQLGLDGAGDRSVLPAVGADLHQARNTGQPVAVAGLV